MNDDDDDGFLCVPYDEVESIYAVTAAKHEAEQKMMADIAVASDRATFRVPELLRGVPDATYAAALPYYPAERTDEMRAELRAGDGLNSGAGDGEHGREARVDHSGALRHLRGLFGELGLGELDLLLDQRAGLP